MGVTARIGVAMGEVRVGASRRAQQLRERMKQENRESSSTRSTFAMRDETQGGEGSERMGGTVTARIRVAAGEVRVGARRRAQRLDARVSKTDTSYRIPIRSLDLSHLAPRPSQSLVEYVSES